METTATPSTLDDSSPGSAPLDTFLRTAVGVDGVDRRIDPRDPLLGFLDRLHHQLADRARFDYFRGGWSVHRLVRQLLRLRFSAAAAGASILDFGSGYGRTTRFLVREHPRDRIVVADVMEDALAFQRETFGVAAQASALDAASLAIAGRFDLVLAISVFTHFHPADFAGWLERLLALLGPRGVLAFTVNDERTLLPGRALDGDGSWFEPTNENDRLDPRRYGSTWVSESFVAAALARVTGAASPAYRRLPRALWASQDVYLVAAPGSAALPDPLPVLLEPAAALEEATVRDDGAVVLRGWAIMPDGAPVAGVRATIEGRGADTVPDRGRDDVAARFASTPQAKPATPGWSLTLEPPAGGFARDAVLTVATTSRDGVDFTIEHDRLASTLGALRIDALHRRIAELEHEVRRRDLELGRRREIEGALWWGVRNRHFELKALKSSLEASRFWKLRNQWWALKRRLGLGS